MKRISIGTWAYSIGPYANNPVPFEEVVDRLAALGFDGVELGGFPPHPNPDDLTTRSQREEVTALIKSKGLEWSGLAANLWGEKLINTDDTSKYVAEFDKNIAFCKDLGIDCIRVDTVQPPTIFDEVDADTARKRVVDTWKVCAAKAADSGVRVVWEFEPGFAFNKPSDIERILGEVNHPNFTVEFDTCHAHMVAGVGARQPGQKETLPGGALELAQRLRGKIGHVHVIDSDGTLHDDETSTHAPIGDGILDLPTLLAELDSGGLPTDWWCIDLCFWPDAWAVTEKCKIGIDALNK
jgi:sugar phosphate isomerase/epimerase